MAASTPAAIAQPDPCTAVAPVWDGRFAAVDSRPVRGAIASLWKDLTAVMPTGSFVQELY
jgi:hypothetical protein